MNSTDNQPICPYAHMQSYQSSNDEINLLDIWHDLWQRRWLIIAITVLVTAVTFAYVTLAPKTYKAEIGISPPPPLTFELATSTWPPQHAAITSTTVFDSAVKYFQDTTIQTQFMNDNTVQSDFTNNLRVTLNKRRKGKPPLSISLIGNSPDAVAKLLNSYIRYVDAYTSQTVLDTLKSILVKKKLAILAQIETARETKRREIAHQIAWLNEQLLIADRLGIVKFTRVEFVGKPAYTRGSEALQAEINSLRQRKNNDIFITALPLLKEQLRVIEMFDFENVKISTMYAGSISRPTNPKSSNRTLITFLGLLMGLMLGIFVAFLQKLVTDHTLLQ